MAELLVLPTEYYHVAIERYFEWEISADKPSRLEVQRRDCRCHREDKEGGLAASVD